MEGRFDIPSPVVSPPAPSLLSVKDHSMVVMVSPVVSPGPDMFPGCLSNFTSYLLRGARAIQTE